MDVGPVVVIPDLFCPRVRAGFVVVKEDDIGLDALRIEDTGRQAQYGVQVSILQQLSAYDFTCAAFE